MPYLLILQQPLLRTQKSNLKKDNAADKGFIDVQYKVRNCYDHGIGVDVDKVIK